jgi:hypothetical protein
MYRYTRAGGGGEGTVGKVMRKKEVGNVDAIQMLDS